MGRPTDEPKSRVIKVRLTEEQLEEIGGGNNLSARIRELIWLGLDKKKIDREAPHYKIADGDLGEIAAMAKCSGISTEQLLRGLRQMLENGEIKCQNGFLYTDVCPFDYKELVGLCQEKRIPPQEAIKKLCQMLARE